MLSEAARNDPAMSGQLDYARIDNDLYPTPVKFVGCLAEHVALSPTKWWEPAVGEGHIALEVERLTRRKVEMSDIVRYPAMANAEMTVADFLTMEKAPDGVNGIITNPPYLTVDVEGDPDWQYLKSLAQRYGMKRLKKVSLAELFLRHAIALMKPVNGMVAMFLRNEFDCGKQRMDLFRGPSFYMKIVCTERPRWIEGSTGSPRHNYSWFVFTHLNEEGTPLVRYSHPDLAEPIIFN